MHFAEHFNVTLDLWISNQYIFKQKVFSECLWCPVILSVLTDFVLWTGKSGLLSIKILNGSFHCF